MKYPPLRILFFTLALTAFSAAAFAASERNVYTCRWMQGRPAYNATHWNNIWSRARRRDDDELIESRFGEYGREAARQLSTDPTVERSYDLESALAEPRATGFLMAYRAEGWYIYIQTKEPLVDKIMEEVAKDNPVGGEGMEIFFSTRPHETSYYMITVDLPERKIEEYVMRPRDRNQRPLGNRMRAETIILPDGTGWGTLVFIPWISFYDRLPFDGESDVWEFSIMRWMSFSKSGGVSWGGKVHEPGAWGLIEWENPSPQQLTEIRRNIISTAWRKYREKAASLRLFWKNDDPAFYNESVLPLKKHFDKYSKQIDNLDEMEDGEVAELYEKVPEWMEFDLIIDDVRKEHLLNKFMEIK